VADILKSFRQHLWGDKPDPKIVEMLEQLKASPEPVLQGSPLGLSNLAGLILRAASEQPPREDGVQLGMIPTPGNLKDFQSKLSSIRSELNNIQAAPRDLDVLAFLKTRYPNRMSVTKYYTPTERLHGNEMAEFRPHAGAGEHVIAWNEQAHPSADVLAASLGHESQHATDLARLGKDFLSRGRETVPPSIAAYNAIPSEVRANQAGDTAMRAYLKYKQLVENYGRR
jgi:hypothetical protein